MHRKVVPLLAYSKLLMTLRLKLHVHVYLALHEWYSMQVPLPMYTILHDINEIPVYTIIVRQPRRGGSI